jgi:hypothetical protein
MGVRHLLSLLEHQFEQRGCGVGPHCSFCGTFTGPFSEIEGLFTVLICIPCLDVRLAQPDSLPGFHDPGQPWEQRGCPIKGTSCRCMGAAAGAARLHSVADPSPCTPARRVCG